MITRAQAITEAREIADRSVRQLIGVLKDSIEYRRTEPLRFALFHGRMARYWDSRKSGFMWRARRAHHLLWEARYSARAWALDQDAAHRCGIKEPLT